MDKYTDYEYKININKCEKNDIQNYNLASYGNLLNSSIASLTTSETSKLLILIDILGKLGYKIDRTNVLTLISIVIDIRYANLIDGIIAKYSTTPLSPNIKEAMSKLISDNALSNQDKAPAAPPKKNPLIEAFMKDILDKGASASFRGWLLPNGQLLSQYNDTTGDQSKRQDHSKLIELFISGLKDYSPEDYAKIKILYENYQQSMLVGDAYESFAVEVLGWIQISHFGRMRLVYRGERWQDSLIRPFLIDYGFNYEISNGAICYHDEFSHLFDHIEEIIELGLEKKYTR